MGLAHIGEVISAKPPSSETNKKKRRLAQLICTTHLFIPITMLTFDHQPESGIRRGRLSIPKKDGEDSVQKRVIETPGCLMYSAKGSVPHLTPDNVRLQDFGGVNVSMEHLL